MKIQLYNSLSKQIEDFNPIRDNIVRMYSCGPTVYNHAHIGNMRSFLFADLMQSTLRNVGEWDLKWVMNITDIDDKTIRGSSFESEAWLPEMGEQTSDRLENLRNFTNYYKTLFLEDIQKLGINLDDFHKIPHATDYISEMQELIRKIFKNGYAYISEGSVYFNVEKYSQAENYGKLKKIDFSNFQKGVRIDADTYERDDANDFVLWKTKKDGEPFWDFELNASNLPGRPGWHMECSTMEYEILGLPFDIHTGGIDLQFPHHEDEIAQSKAGYGIDPNPFWCHNEFLEVEGKKMSKSLGNFYSLRELLDKGLDPLDIRFAMLMAHYRTKYNFTFAGVEAAAKARQKVQDYIYQLFEESSDNSINEIPENKYLPNTFFGEIAIDLHTPKALSKLFEFISNYPAGKLSNELKNDLKQVFVKINSIFKIWEIAPKPENNVLIPQEILDIAEQRFQAKKDKNWTLADELRSKITQMGYSILDSKDGYEIKQND
ncbi:MAG: cysteine--tRNA ligase [Ignavibacteria bacterium GWF2_33_9]|nr:MAG: cysteine--tRNA ligase [Ignavibacteria bacterium GWF2_33_9]